MDKTGHKNSLVRGRAGGNFTSPVAVKVKVGHTQKWSTMTKESNEGEFLEKKSVDHNRKRIENLSKANAIKEKVIHLDQLEFLPIFFYSKLLIWMLPAPNVTGHSYFDSVYLKIFTALSFLTN